MIKNELVSSDLKINPYCYSRRIKGKCGNNAANTWFR